jgi:DNA-binding XRE family transcriptional regulator
MGKRITQDQMAPFARALRAARLEAQLLQEDLADRLGMSRKTYILFETGRWFPPYKERAWTMRQLQNLDPGLVEPFLAVANDVLADHALEIQPPPPPPRDPNAARATFDAIVAQVAAERDMTTSAVTKVAASLVGRFLVHGISVDDAVTILATS